MDKIVEMTDEEKAKEYVENTRISDIDKGYDNRNVYYCGLEKGFIDGLAEGRKEKLHDLRKHPDDLPKNKEMCLCLISKDYFVGFYDKDDEEWCFDEFYSNTITAWCELPKFKE